MPITGLGGTKLAAAAGYSVSNSVRVNRADSPVLAFTPDSTTDREKGTFSCWIKPSGAYASAAVFGFGDDYAKAYFTDNPGVSMLFKPDGKHHTWAYGPWKEDPAAWQHWMFSWDTAQATPANRGRCFRNGVEMTTSFSSAAPTQSIDTDFNLSGTAMFVGNADKSGTRREYWDGYLAEVAWIDGTQITDPTTFGEFSSTSPNTFIPKDFKDDVTFGDNGFYLEFKENGTDADASGLGADTSGNNNHFTLTNYAATDQSIDSPTNNFCVLNPHDKRSSATLKEGNLDISTTANGWFGASGTLGFKKGFACYWEAKAISSARLYFGLSRIGQGVRKECLNDSAEGSADFDYMWRATSANTVFYGGSDQSITITAISANDICACHVATDGEVKFYKNDSLVVTFSTKLVDGYWYFPILSANAFGGGTESWQANFGSPPYANSSSQSDPDGYGDFEYTTKSAYALCTKNLANYGG